MSHLFSLVFSYFLKYVNTGSTSMGALEVEPVKEAPPNFFFTKLKNKLA